MKRSGINVEQLNALSQKIVMEKFNERGEGQGGARIILAFALMGILCITIMAYGTHLMSAVIEEKQSRIMEVLISSVKPFTLMFGKLLGVGMVGLTQYVVWSISGILLSSFAAMQSSMLGLFNMPQISVSLMIFFVIYFLLGYFLYATLYTMVGGVVSNEEDGQQMQLPLMALILLAPLATSFVWRMPESALATAISIFPFFSPFGMFLRIAIAQPPWWQIALSILLLVAAIFGAVWLTARFYRIGVLMYGKRPTIAEMGKWLKYS
jgi:ABC-2 type transport system permease protein